MMQCHAFYKLPGQKEYTSIESESQFIIHGESFDDTVSGFLITPFRESEYTPAVFIPGDRISSRPIPARHEHLLPENIPLLEEVRQTYRSDFEEFHDAVVRHDFEKLVLSRMKTVITDDTPDIMEMFFEACRRYPHMAVMMFRTPATGTWLISSPEPLLEYADGICHTVALAGTMRHDGEWSEKNRLEQALVERFIEDTIRPFCDTFETDGPHTVTAGDLVHLRTDISFESCGRRLAEMAFRLHPTPAVCGIPRSRAGEFITLHEHTDRKYYSGFAGPIGIRETTHLYVSLRCAYIEPELKKITLYAGGGIMPGSDCSSEFAETEYKMQTIAKCIVTRKTSIS